VSVSDLGLAASEAAELGRDAATRIRTFRLILLVATELRTLMDKCLRGDGLTTQQAQLVLRRAGVESEAERPARRAAAILATLPLRPEDPSAPRPRTEPSIELASRTLEVTNNERNLKRGKALERRHHPRNLVAVSASGRLRLSQNLRAA
jgi:hypothetical protein